MKQTNLEIVRKDSKTYVLLVKRNGVAEDISGWVLTFYVKTDFNDLDAAALIAKSITFPSNTDSQNGIGYLALTSTDTNIALGEFYYDAKLIDGTNRETFLQGMLQIVQTIKAS